MVHSGQFTDLGSIKYANVAEDKKLCKTFTSGAANGIEAEGLDKQSKCYKFNKILDKDPNELLNSL